MIVVDASATIAMLLDEKEHVADGRTFIVFTESELIVPSHWPAEIGNALLANIRRGRLSVERLSAIVQRLDVFRVTIQHPPLTTEIESSVLRALRDGLTYYDALYVQLAMKHNIPLFTLDMQMRAVAEKQGVTVMPA